MKQRVKQVVFIGLPFLVVGLVTGGAIVCAAYARTGRARQEDWLSGKIEDMPMIGSGDISCTGDNEGLSTGRTYHWNLDKAEGISEIGDWLREVEKWCALHAVVVSKNSFDTAGGSGIVITYEMNGIIGIIFCLGEQTSAMSQPKCTVVVREVTRRRRKMEFPFR